MRKSLRVSIEALSQLDRCGALATCVALGFISRECLFIVRDVLAESVKSSFYVTSDSKVATHFDILSVELPR